jgi:hypothetical protein
LESARVDEAAGACGDIGGGVFVHGVCACVNAEV